MCEFVKIPAPYICVDPDRLEAQVVDCSLGLLDQLLVANDKDDVKDLGDQLIHGAEIDGFIGETTNEVSGDRRSI